MTVPWRVRKCFEEKKTEIQTEKSLNPAFLVKEILHESPRLNWGRMGSEVKLCFSIAAFVFTIMFYNFIDFAKGSNPKFTLL